MAEVPISIKPEREYLHEILKRIDSGSYAIPLFQRNFVWNNKQILDLFDSISKGYPIGSILLWRPKDKEAYKYSKDIVDDKTIDNTFLDYYILDGRQRLTTFYGCLYGKGEYDDRFKVYYNLSTEMFEYSPLQNKPIHLVALPDLYDTFKLLDKLQEIQEKTDDKETARAYITRAKKINSIFQGYQIGELLFENYTLEEAGTVFARINSKGTDISKVSMLQALFYKEGQQVLFSDWVGNMKNKLGKWGFDRLREEDILNCCYRYSKLNFYDHDLMEKIDKLDFINKLDEIESDLMREAEFMHNECGIISVSMLPYARQWVIMAGLFKEKKTLDDADKKELKKWLYYTSVCQTFMNSSMSIVRSHARRFEKFIVGEKSSAIDYKPIELPSLNFSFQLTSALSCFLMIALVKNYEKISGRKAVYLGEYRALGGKITGGVIPYFYDDASCEIYALMNIDKDVNINLEALGLDKEIIEAWYDEDYIKFINLREAKLYGIETKLLTDSGLEIKEAQKS